MRQRFTRAAIALLLLLVLPLVAMTILRDGGMYEPYEPYDGPYQSTTNWEEAFPRICRDHMVRNEVERGDMLFFDWTGTQAEYSKCLEALSAGVPDIGGRNVLTVDHSGFIEPSLNDLGLQSECTDLMVKELQGLHPWGRDQDIIHYHFTGTDAQRQLCADVSGWELPPQPQIVHEFKILEPQY